MVTSLGESGDPRRYIQIAAQIRGQIERGDLAAGQPVPSITTLSQAEGCSRPTAGKALRMLEAEGLLSRWPGKGYYVR